MSSNVIGSLYFSIGADTKKYDAAVAEMKKSEEALANLKLKNDDAIRRREDELEALRMSHAKTAERLAQAEQAQNQKTAQKLRAELDKIEIAIHKTDKARERAILRATQAESALTKKIEEQRKAVESMPQPTSKLGGAFSKLGSVAAGAFSVAMISRFVDKLDSLAKRARDIGMTASQLQEFEHQAKLAGMSAGELDSSVKSFAKNIGLAAMGSGKAGKALEEMGISLTDANGLTKDQSVLLRETAQWFEKNAGAAENAGLATRLFGNEGVEMLRVFEQGGDVVDTIFDANSIDEAAAAAERFKDGLENIQNVAMKLAAPIVEGWGHIADFLGNDLWNGIGDAAYQRAQKKANDDAKKLRGKILEAERARKKAAEEAEEAQRKADAEAEERIKKLGELDNKLAQSRFEREATNSQKIAALKRQIATISANIIYYDKSSVEYGEKYARIIEAQIKLEQLQSAEEKKLAAERKKANEEAEKSLETRANNALKRLKELQGAQKSQAQSRSEFEYETKLEILRKQGRGKEADALENLRKRNELMEKYGYSLEQATKIQKTLDDLKKPGGGTEYSDEAKKKAQEIVDRGAGGTVGKKTLAEAQAILKGETPEGGLQTAMFKKYGDTAKPSAVNEAKVDTAAMKTELDDKAQQTLDDQKNALDEMNTLMDEVRTLTEEIKTAVDGQTASEGTTLKEILTTLKSLIAAQS